MLSNCISLIWVISLALIFSFPLKAQEEPKQETSAAEEEYQSLLEEFQESRRARPLASKFLALAEKYADQPQAVDALKWVIINLRYRPPAQQALELLGKNHLSAEKLAGLCEPISQMAGPASEKLLQTAIEKSPHRIVQAQACFHLAALLEHEFDLAKQLYEQPDLRRRARQAYGKDVVDHLMKLDRHQIDQQRERLYLRLVDSYGDVPTDDGLMKETAGKALFALRHLALGKPAPEITGEDIDGKRMKLSNYRGKVVMLSFWAHW